MSVHEKYNISIEEYTTPCPITIAPDTMFGKIVNLMEDEDIRHLPVVEGGKPVGMVSQRDVSLVAAFPDCGDFMAQDFMAKNPYLILSNATLEKAAFDLSQNKIGSALVVNRQGELSGIFTSTDALNALVEILRGEIED